MAGTIFVLSLVFISLILTTNAMADEPSSQGTERAAWHAELSRLERDEPAKYEEMRSTFTLMAELTLAKLGYASGPFTSTLTERYRSALRSYQKDRSIPVTGDPLSFETVEKLRADEDILEYRPVSLPPRHVFTRFWDKGYVSARGTWIITEDKMGSPEQTSEIECMREHAVCTEATAILDGEIGARSLSVHIDRYEIERWDEHELVTKPLQFGCTRYVRRFSRIQNSVTGIRSTTSQEETCKAVSPKEMYLVLSDGFEVYWQLNQERARKWRKLVQISPELLRMLESKTGRE